MATDYLETFGKIMAVLVPIILASVWALGRMLNNRAKALANEMQLMQLQERVDDLEASVEKLKDKFENYKDSHK